MSIVKENATAISIETLRQTFNSVFDRLQSRAEMIDDDLVRKATWAYLEIFRRHADTITEEGALTDYCTSVTCFMVPKLNSALFNAESKDAEGRSYGDLQEILHRALFGDNLAAGN